jgi:hypothetical protein
MKIIALTLVTAALTFPAAAQAQTPMLKLQDAATIAETRASQSDIDASHYQVTHYVRISRTAIKLRVEYTDEWDDYVCHESVRINAKGHGFYRFRYRVLWSNCW